MSNEKEKKPKTEETKPKAKESKINAYGFWGTSKAIREALEIPKGKDHPVEVTVDKEARTVTLKIK